MVATESSLVRVIACTATSLATVRFSLALAVRRQGVGMPTWSRLNYLELEQTSQTSVILFLHAEPSRSWAPTLQIHCTVPTRTFVLPHASSSASLSCRDLLAEVKRSQLTTTLMDRTTQHGFEETGSLQI
jgi:hypothetical protein